jgi:hypothetical protein
MFKNNLTFNTGAARHIVGHAFSGAAASAIVSGTHNALKYKNGQIQKEEAFKDTLKNAAIWGTATASAIAAANAIGDPRKSVFQAISALALGFGAVYSIEKITQKQTITKEISNAKTK